MVCSRANELISEYIDEVLEDKIKLELEAHFRECSFCKQRLEAQKVIVKRLNSVEPVKPPEDFLLQVHSRIERRAEFEKLMKKAFIPGKKKMSLEAVGVLVTVVLVIIAHKYIQKDFAWYPSQPVKMQAVTKESKIISSSSGDLGESEAFIPEVKQSVLKAQEERIVVPENKEDPIPALPSSLAVQKDVFPIAVQSTRTGGEAQQAWEPKQFSFDESLGPERNMESQSLEKNRFLKDKVRESAVDKSVSLYTKEKTEGYVTSVQPMRDLIVSAGEENVNKTAAFQGESPAERSEQLNITDTSVNINSDLTVKKTEYLSEAEKIDYQEGETTLSKQNTDVKSAVSKSVIEPAALVVLRIDTERLAMDRVYSDIIKFVSGVGGSVIRSEYDKDGTMRALIVRIPSDNVLKLKEYLQTAENISEKNVEVTSFTAQE